MPDKQATWWPRVTVADMVSWPTVLLTAFGGLSSYAVGNTALVSGTPMIGVITGVAAMGVFFAVIYGAWLIGAMWQAMRHSVTGAVTVTIVAAGLRGATVWWFHHYFGVDDPAGLGDRILASELALAPIALVSAGIVVALRAHRDAQHDMTRLELAIDRVDDVTSNHIETFTATIISEARQGIAEVAEALRAAAKTGESDDALEVIRRVSNDVVSPLARSLRMPGPTLPHPTIAPRLPSIDWALVIRSAMAGRPHAPLFTGVLFGVGIIPHTLVTMGPATGLVLSALWGGVIAMLLWLQNVLLVRVPSEWSAWGRFWAIGALAIVGSLALVGLSALAGETGDLDPLTVGVLANAGTNLPLSLATIMLAKGLLAQIRVTLVLRDLKQQEFDAEMTKANELFWQRRTALSHTLHGPVQAALNSVELRTQALPGTRGLSPELVEDMVATLDETATRLSGVREVTTDLRVTLERVRGTWEGLCVVEWSAPPRTLDYLSSRPESAGVSEILVEAVFNAVRHSHATAVDITLEIVARNTLMVRVENDGAPPDIGFSSGQGSELFDLLSQRWSLAPRSHSPSGGSVLELNIPLNERH